MIRTEGFTEILADFTQAPLRMRLGAHGLVRDVAARVKSTAQANAPRRSGRLSRSIEMEMMVGGEGARPDTVAAEVGPTIFYGSHVEDGTATTGPRPFLSPALDEHAHELTSGLADLLDPFR